LLSVSVACLLAVAFPPGQAVAQNDVAFEKIEAHAVNRPLPSLAAAAKASRLTPAVPRPPREVMNITREVAPAPAVGPSAPAVSVQGAAGVANTSVEGGFFGSDNNDNGSLLGFLIAPPDTDGAVGPNHYVQMINLLTTVFGKSGSVVLGPFASNAIWTGIGGNCEAYNQGDPIVLYDDVADRWVFSQFAFPDNMASFSQCVAVSQTGDPTQGYNRYEFPFTAYGFNDYPKHGIVTNSITMTANLFKKRGASYYFNGTFLGVMDKAAMYAGQSAGLIGYNIGTAEFGFVAGDLDGPGTVPALFATAMSTTSAFDIWKIDVDWTTDSASVGRIARVPVAAFDKDLCSATREACVPQPDGGPALEAISDRLMHRLQVRDFGGHRTMVTAHTVDAGGGRAGIRWYELRETGGTWSLYQQGTYAPADGKHRFIPSAAMNHAGDIGIGYLLSSTTTYVSTAVAGQSAAASGTGVLDSAEVICAAGSGVQQGTGRSGDYSATSVDPNLDTFWHTNEVFTTTGNFQWATFVCEFSVGSGGSVNQPPTAAYTYACTGLSCAFTDASSDSDGTITARNWNFGDGATSTATNPSHTYAAAGTYSVALTVTDDDGATDTETKSVTVTAPTNFTLTLRSYTVRTKWRVDLTWSGATGASVDVFKNGAKLTTTPNDGLYTDSKGLTTGNTYTYKVCNAGTTTCSNEASVTLTP
jgi:PKD repeat protein